MAIVRMKHFRLLGLEQDRKKLLNSFQRLGCVQIDLQTDKLADEDWAGLIGRPETNLNAAKDTVALLQNALSILGKYAESKGGMLKKLFTARPEVSMGDLHNEVFLKETFKLAADIQENARVIADLVSEQSRLENNLSALQPWKGLDIPLESKGSEVLTVLLGVCPASFDAEELCRRLGELPGHGEKLHSDNDQHYLSVIYHPSAEEEVSECLKSFGFSKTSFKEHTGLPAENIKRIEKRLKEIEEERLSIEKAIAEYGTRKPDLERALDASNVALQREEAAERLLSTGKVYYMEGWVPERFVSSLEQFLSQVDCAYETRFPEPDEEVPVLLHNHKWIQPFSMVTEMYALPKYNNIDPNPLIAFFYAAFFGMMYGDVAYGLILFVLGWLVTKKGKPKGMMGNAFRLMMICGLSTVFFGFLFGGFFSDALTVISEEFFGMEEGIKAPALWTGPTDYENNGPVNVLILSLALGMIQIITGMAIKGYLLIRDGQAFAAVMEILPWWFFFTSIGITALTGASYWVFGGLGLLVLTQGYKKKGIIKKFLFGLLSLYDITSYLGDILSYSRLMALGLAGGVIASVFNILGAMPSDIPVLGPVIFVVIFLAGHAFNMAINIIGTYVHAARLQYIEYFSKFYESGGKAFRPLCTATKYVDVVEPDKG